MTKMAGDGRANGWRSLQEAERLLRLGEPEQALRRVRLVLRRDPDHLGALELMAKALWAVGQLEEVVLCSRRLESLYPYEPGYFVTEGEALRELGRLEEARAAFRRAEETIRLAAEKADPTGEDRLTPTHAVVEVPVADGLPEPADSLAVAQPHNRKVWTV
ncbi:MAG: hypothetical protein LDL56_05080 [Armatimonadetes bacterium]|nr:hypothetical protein [Armatimonadota bacterium]MCA1996588.1 hypothetical protein [Armatimonadota bacterium]